MVGGGLMQIVANGGLDIYYKGDYSYLNKIGYGKTNPYTGKNNFYKKLKKSDKLKKDDIIL